MERKPGRPRALTVEQIAQAALDDGLSNFSMPSVARRLGVAHSGLYRYVADREALLVTSLSRAIGTVEWPAADLPWEELLREIGESLWTLCDKYPGLDTAALGAPSSPQASSALVEAYVEQLHHEGFSLDDAAAAIDFVISLTLSASAEMARLRRSGRPGLASGASETLKAYDSDEVWTGRGWYSRKLDIVIGGLGPRRIG